MQIVKNHIREQRFWQVSVLAGSDEGWRRRETGRIRSHEGIFFPVNNPANAWNSRSYIRKGSQIQQEKTLDSENLGSSEKGEIFNPINQTGFAKKK